MEGVWFVNHRVSSFLYADVVVLLVSLGLDLQYAQGWFPAKCEVAGMRVSSSKFEVMVRDQKRVECTLRVVGVEGGLCLK